MFKRFGFTFRCLIGLYLLVAASTTANAVSKTLFYCLCAITVSFYHCDSCDIVYVTQFDILEMH